MDSPTTIAKDWLGRAQADDEVRRDMRNLALAADHRPLANAMRTYVTGAAMTELTPQQKGEVDFDRLAADWQALARRFTRASSSGKPPSLTIVSGVS